MNRPANYLTVVTLWLMLLPLLLAVTSVEATATEHSFPAGSYIIPADSCWQPNNDSANTVTSLPAYCDTNKNDKSLFQMFAALYALLDTGDQPDKCLNKDGSTPQQPALLLFCKLIKVYWLIEPGKTSPHDPDLTLKKVDASPIVTIMNSAKVSSGTAEQISYSGGPFVIDGNDITPEQIAKLAATFPSVKIHKTNVPFTGKVDKILIGKPPRVAVLSEGASDVLEDYIRAAGLFSWRNTVYQYVSQTDILNGCLDNPVPASCTATRPDIRAPFTLLWAPHWIVAGTADQQKQTISNIRNFLQSGNSGFFECASIESIEGSGKTVQTGENVNTAGGYLVGAGKATPRLDTNGGCSDNGKCDADYLKFEQASSWLTQCGGWNFEATGGHVHNMRPTMATSYNYLTTLAADSNTTPTVDDRFVGTQVTRFIHDDPAKLAAAYSPVTNYHVYDYLTAGRINGSPGEGYVIYMPGHKFIQCGANVGFNYPPSRTLDFIFDKNPSDGSVLTIQVVHASCTKDSTCPTAQYTIGGDGTRSTVKGSLTVSAELAEYDPSASRLSAVRLTNSNDDPKSVDLLITGVYLTITGDTTGAKLINIADMTESFNRSSLCVPNTTVTPSACTTTERPESRLAFTFSKNIPAGDIRMKIVQGAVNAEAKFKVDAATQNPADCRKTLSNNNLIIDACSASYDPTHFTLSNVIIKPGGNPVPCADQTLTDIDVDFPVADNTLTVIYNDTTDEEVCASNMKHRATCSKIVIPPYAIATELSWASPLVGNTTPPADLALTIKYTCSPACGTTSISATRGNVTTNADVTLDLKNTSVTGSKLSNIKLTFSDRAKTYILTSYNLAYAGSTAANSAVTYWNTTNNKAIFSVKTKAAPGQINKKYTVTAPPPLPASTWTYTFGKGICSSYYVSPYLSDCAINWGQSNTCGIKYVLNTLLALKYMSVDNEYSKTQPLATSYLAQDNRTVLYKSSYYYPSYRGSLKMIKPPTATQEKVDGWDAANAMPPAGTANFPTAPLAGITDNSVPRYIFTTLPGSTETIRFDPVSFLALADDKKTTLKTSLMAGSDNDAAIVTINRVRGRKGVSTNDINTIDSCAALADGTTDLYGCGEDTKRLWAIENSTPALKTKSRYVESTADDVTQGAVDTRRDRRDRILFAGADDGMLHAFWAGAYDPITGSYPDTAVGRGTGKEIWAYIPSALLPYLKDQPFNPDPSDVSNFEPTVAVDGSPAIGDFLVCLKPTYDKDGKFLSCGTLANGKSGWVWKTRLVGTAMIRSKSINRGLIFALDITDPYTPQLLWEYSYDKGDAGCSGTSRDCNMGNSRGVSIGTTLIGNQLKDYAFLTSSWIKSKKVKTADGSDTGKMLYDPATNEYQYVTCEEKDPSVRCTYGISAYALDLDTGDVMWERSLPYTGDAVSVNETPAIPALMDRDNNGSYDYVVFGDMQGRLWALRTTDGRNLTDNFTADNHVSKPVYELKELDASLKDTATLNGAKEPIGAPVSVYRDYVVLGTGGADVASSGSAGDPRAYRVEVVKIGIGGAAKDDNMTVKLTPYDAASQKGNEKVWAKPAITSDLKVYVATARSYYRQVDAAGNAINVSQFQSDGRVLVIDLRVKRDDAKGITNFYTVGGDAAQWHQGGFVGGFDFDRRHAYIVTFKPTKVGNTSTSVLQIGSPDDFNPTASNVNPYKVLWWRKM